MASPLWNFCLFFFTKNAEGIDRHRLQRSLLPSHSVRVKWATGCWYPLVPATDGRRKVAGSLYMLLHWVRQPTCAWTVSSIGSSYYTVRCFVCSAIEGVRGPVGSRLQRHRNCHTVTGSVERWSESVWRVVTRLKVSCNQTAVCHECCNYGRA